MGNSPALVRPPRNWEAGTIVLLVAIGGAGAFTFYVLLLGFAVQRYLRGDEYLRPFVGLLVRNPINALGFLLVLGYIIGFFVWRNRTRALARDFGIEPVSLTAHRGVRVWGGATVVAWLVARGGSDEDAARVDGLISSLQLEAVASVLRLIGLAALARAIWVIRHRVGEALANYAVRPVPAFTPPPSYGAPPWYAAPPPYPAPPSYAAPPPYPTPPTYAAPPPYPTPPSYAAPPPYTAPPPYAAVPPAPVAPPAAARDIPGIDGLPFADGDFWNRVRQAAAEADLALLVTSGPNLHRWVLVPAGQDPATVWRSLSPGAAITVFTEPLTRRETNGYRPAKAAEYHGLLESAVTGAIRYQSVTPRQLVNFLDRAETGGRWALYPADDPNALTARLP